jgi:hypothetical protein
MMKDEGYRTIILGERHALLAIVCELIGACPECRAPVVRTPDLCELRHRPDCQLAATTARAT